MKRTFEEAFFTPTKFGVPNTPSKDTPRRAKFRKELKDYPKLLMSAMQVDTPGRTASSFKKGRKGPRSSVKARGRKLTPKQRGEVKKLIALRQELKYSTNTLTTSSVITTAAVGLLYTIPQGDADTDRSGDSLMWCGTMELNYQCINGMGATGDAYNNIRLIIFQWHPNSTPVSTSVLLNGPSTAPDIYSVYSHDNRQEYSILYDSNNRTIGPSGSGSLPITAASVTGMIRVRLNTSNWTKHVQYQGGSSTVGTNLIYYMYMSDSALATHPTITWMSKVFYRDS